MKIIKLPSDSTVDTLQATPLPYLGVMNHIVTKEVRIFITGAK